MSDSGSSIGETRMLERRISNNRADLNGDQQMNYFLSWFNSWSDLQKSDFVSVLSRKMATCNGDKGINGLAKEFDFLSTNGNHEGSNNRPPSLFACQIKLFNEWFSGWSDDQKNYLTLRLRDIDATFYQKYEDKIQNPHSDEPKDYFEPGIPPELVRKSVRTSEKENDNLTSEDGKETKTEQEPSPKQLQDESSTSQLESITED